MKRSAKEGRSELTPMKRAIKFKCGECQEWTSVVVDDEGLPERLLESVGRKSRELIATVTCPKCGAEGKIIIKDGGKP